MFECLGLDTNSWVSPLHKSVEFSTSNQTEMDRYWYVEGTLEKHAWPENVTSEYK